MEIFLVVHDQGGEGDPPLSEGALDRARMLAKALADKKKNKKDKSQIKMIFSGPSLACIQTTDCVHDELGVKTRVISGFAARAAGEADDAFRARVKEAIEFVRAETPKGCPLIVGDISFGRGICAAFGKTDAVEAFQLVQFGA